MNAALAIYPDDTAVLTTRTQMDMLRPRLSYFSSLVSDVAFAPERKATSGQIRAATWTAATERVRLLLTRALRSGNSDATGRTIKAVTDLAHLTRTLATKVEAPKIFAAEDGELCLEWISQNRRAVVTLVGDGELGYALLRNGRFEPGTDMPIGTHETDLSVLVTYLTD
jgi:hypothetical protein